MIEEQKLVCRILAGELSAQEEFDRIFRPRLIRASVYFLGNQDAEAEDIVQETFLIAFAKFHNYDFAAPIFAWLRQICLRLCYARMRSRRRVLVSLEEDLEMSMQGMALARVQSVELEAQKQVKLGILDGLKKQLNQASAQIIELRNVQGMSYTQISQALKIPMGTVMSRLARARDQLRKLAENQAEASPAQKNSRGKPILAVPVREPAFG
jgi:RNA polymerase sigma-70 factor (ECF subfamily)